MNGPLYFDDVNIGDTWTTHGRTVTEADVVNFACLTGDCDPLHVDEEQARESLFGKRIAHGLLGISWMAGLSIHNPWMKTVAFISISEWKFLKPIFFGDTVHVVTEVTAKEPHGRRRGRVTWKRQLINQNGEVTQEGVLDTLVERTRP